MVELCSTPLLYRDGIDANSAGLLLKEDLTNKSPDVNLGNSNILYPSQNAVKTYVDSQIGGSVQTIVSTDANNSISASLIDGGAFYDDTSLQNNITSNTAAIAADGDTDAANEIQDIGEVLAEGNDGGGLLIKNILDPVDPQDAATRAFVLANAGTGTTEMADQVTIVGDGTSGNEFEVADGAINSAKIEDGSVTAVDLMNNGIINSTKIIDGTITSIDMENGAVETANILDANVTPIKIAPSATNDQFLSTDAGGNVVWADLPPSAVNQNLSDVLILGNDAGGALIRNIAEPILPQDVATKQYVDDIAIGGRQWSPNGLKL